MDFYLGTHMPHWLRDSTVPLFVSHRRLQRNKTVPRARCRWALDSGGFTELSMFGGWKTSAVEYVSAVERYQREVGMLDWAAPQDWMCEPWIVDKTGLSVQAHQALTIRNYRDLMRLAPDAPFVPVLQGWELDDYLRHVKMYGDAGVDLREHRIVGIGSVCRRQDTEEITEIVQAVSEQGIALHGFGVKGGGLKRFGRFLASADSMAWSYRGRMIFPCPHSRAKSCANCRVHALEWRERALAGL